MEYLKDMYQVRPRTWYGENLHYADRFLVRDPALMPSLQDLAARRVDPQNMRAIQRYLTRVTDTDAEEVVRLLSMDLQTRLISEHDVPPPAKSDVLQTVELLMALNPRQIAALSLPKNSLAARILRLPQFQERYAPAWNTTSLANASVASLQNVDLPSLGYALSQSNALGATLIERVLMSLSPRQLAQLGLNESSIAGQTVDSPGFKGKHALQWKTKTATLEMDGNHYSMLEFYRRILDLPWITTLDKSLPKNWDVVIVATFKDGSEREFNKISFGTRVEDYDWDGDFYYGADGMLEAVVFARRLSNFDLEQAVDGGENVNFFSQSHLFDHETFDEDIQETEVDDAATEVMARRTQELEDAFDADPNLSMTGGMDIVKAADGSIQRSITHNNPYAYDEVDPSKLGVEAEDDEIQNYDEVTSISVSIAYRKRPEPDWETLLEEGSSRYEEDESIEVFRERMKRRYATVNALNARLYSGDDERDDDDDDDDGQPQQKRARIGEAHMRHALEVFKGDVNAAAAFLERARS